MSIHPLKVTGRDGRTLIFVANATDQVPSAFVLMATNAAERVIVRIAGGCSGMDLADKNEMREFFLTGLRGFAGVAFSGGTRQLDANGELDPMVTDLPGLIVQHSPHAIALGTAPRTSRPHLTGMSQFVLSEDGMLLQPGMSAVLLVQSNPNDPADWDGDLNAYVRAMEDLRTSAHFRPGFIAWNGGGVTAKEIEIALAMSWPMVLVRGSGRKTDEMITRFDSGELSARDNVVIVDRQHPEQLRQAALRFQWIGNTN